MPRKENEEITSLRRMTKKGLRDLCKKNKLYQTPELNDVLYLHYQGYQDIECLEEYTGLKCLWLESNAISDIKGLENAKKLKCLFLHNNLIRKIENLEFCRELDTLNLSSNHISRIENCGVDKLPVLTTLTLSHNYLKCMEDLQNLTECKQLSVLDLANNRIEDILVVKILAQMPELRVLVLTGNPVVSRIPQYRKTLILECKELTYLDSRPVFPRDRACAEAWKRGGYEEERREHERWNKADRKKMRDSVNATLRIRNRGGGDPQVDLIASSSDEDDGFTERSSAPTKEDLQNMTKEEVNAEIFELMRLGDLVEYEKNEKCTKKSVINEQENEVEEFRANPCIINQTVALPENKLMSANKCDEDTTPNENSEALDRYDKTYKQAYDNYIEYVKILTNQDHTAIRSDQSEEKENTEEFEVKNNDNCAEKIDNNESDDFNETTKPNLISILNDEQMNSVVELTNEDEPSIELEKDSREINFVQIKNKDDTSIAESGNEKMEDITDSEMDLKQSGIVRNDLPSELQASSDSEICKKVNDPEKEFSCVKPSLTPSIIPTSNFDSYLSVNSQTNNLSIPSHMFSEIIKNNEIQLASGSDAESDELEENLGESHDDECKTKFPSIKEFVSNYKEFLGSIDDRKSSEKKETGSEKFNKVDEDKFSDTLLVDVDSDSDFRKLRFFVQDSPNVEEEEQSKSQIIARLLENPITKEISSKDTCKTLEELDEQLKCIKEEQSKWIQKVSDKCYSQGDRYNDDLEIINGELVVIRKYRNSPNDTTDKFGENIHSQDMRQEESHTEIKEDLQNDDSDVSASIHEDDPYGESTEFIKCNEYKEQNNHTQKEDFMNKNLANLGVEPSFSNRDLFNNSQTLSDSDSIKEYFMQQMSSPPNVEVTHINTETISTLETTPEKERKCNLCKKKIEPQYYSTEILLTSEVTSGKQQKSNLSEIEIDLHDAAEFPSTLEACSEEEKCNFPEKEAERQYDNSEILSTSGVISEEEIKCNISETELQYVSVGSPSNLGTSSKEEKETELQYEIPSSSEACSLNVNLFEIEAEFHDTEEIQSILEASLKELNCSFPEKTVELQIDNSQVVSASGVISEEGIKTEFQCDFAKTPLTLEISSKEERKCNLYEKEAKVKFDSTESSSILEASSGKQRNINFLETETEFHDASEISSTLQANSNETKWNFPENEAELQTGTTEVLSTLEANLKEEIKYNLSETELQYSFAENLSTSETSSEDERKFDLYQKGKELQYDYMESPSTSEASTGKQLKCNPFEIEADGVKIISTLEGRSEERKWNFCEKEAELEYSSAENLRTLGTCLKEEQMCNFFEKGITIPSDFEEIPPTFETSSEERKYNLSENEVQLQCSTKKIPTTLKATLENTSEEPGTCYLSKNEKKLQYGAAEILFSLEAISEKQKNFNLSVEEREHQYDAAAYDREDQSSTAGVKGLGNASENFEWVKSSIFTLASGGMTKESKGTEANTKLMYSSDPEIDKIHHDIDEDFHKDLTSLFINASLEYKMVESAEKYGDPDEESSFDIEERAQWYLEELKNHLPPEMKDLISNENKNWHRFSGDANEFRNSNNLDDNPHVKRLHEILKSRNAAPGAMDKDKALLKLVLANKDYLLNHEKPQARELAKRILKDNGIEEPDADSVSTEVNLSNTSTEVVEERFSI